MAKSNFEFSRNLPFSDFVENGSWIQRLDPGLYLLAFLIFFSAILLTNSLVVVAAGIAFCLLGLMFSGLQPVAFLGRIIKILPIILLLGVITALINSRMDDRNLLWQFWIFRISLQGVEMGLAMVLKFLVFMFSIGLTTASFPISRFMHGLEDILSPLKWIGIQIHDFIVSVEIAIRYIPILTLTAERIAKAQAARGANWDSSGMNIISRARQVMPILVPLFLQSFQKADRIAIAMDARGYGLEKKRSRYYTNRVSLKDFYFLAISILFLAGAILLHLTNPLS